MSFIQMALLIPAALLVVALVHDFLAGLGEERLWSDPVAQDPDSFTYQTTVAGRSHNQEKVVFPEGAAGYTPSWDQVLAPVPQS
jgi:hypothetical protein